MVKDFDKVKPASNSIVFEVDESKESEKKHKENNGVHHRENKFH